MKCVVIALLLIVDSSLAAADAEANEILSNSSSINVTTDAPIDYDSSGARIYIVGMVFIFAFIVFLLLLIRIKPSVKYHKDKLDREKAEHLLRGMEEQLVTKKILEQLRNEKFREKAWNIYHDGEISDETALRRFVNEETTLKNLHKKIENIHRSKLDKDLDIEQRKALMKRFSLIVDSINAAEATKNNSRKLPSNSLRRFLGKDLHNQIGIHSKFAANNEKMKMRDRLGIRRKSLTEAKTRLNSIIEDPNEPTACAASSADSSSKDTRELSSRKLKREQTFNSLREWAKKFEHENNSVAGQQLSASNKDLRLDAGASEIFSSMSTANLRAMEPIENTLKTRGKKKNNFDLLRKHSESKPNSRFVIESVNSVDDPNRNEFIYESKEFNPRRDPDQAKNPIDVDLTKISVSLSNNETVDQNQNDRLTSDVADQDYYFTITGSHFDLLDRSS